MLRFLKSLPNWEAVFEDEDVGGGGRGGGRGVEESVEEVEKRNRKETEILVQNLGSSDIPQHEILSDSNQLR